MTSLEALHAAELTPAQLRQTMVASQLRTVGVTDAGVLAAMAAVPREDYVAPALAGLAYADAALEVAPGRWLLEPMVLALLLQNARVTAADRVLLVGAATGYSAAVLAHVGARVTALECDAALIAQATAAGIACVSGPLADGWAGAAPYDLVLFEGAIEIVTPAIAAQLAPGGRVAAIVRDGGGHGVGRGYAGPLLADRRIGGLAFLEVPGRLLPGFARPKDFAF
ncbi:MAG: protein-L-isoaspartate O-methyltransferase [Alphaproteobacteria bacterium PA4]|nr:MAG: protein-L-isoaspartate O-methyltransferase [Alphaproteobacteria bacterium PA4]